MSEALPLTGHASPEAVIAYRPEGPVTVARFLADVARLAERLPAGRPMLNLCQDRYRFMAGLAAGISAGSLSLLPSSLTAETVARLREGHPELFCLADGPADCHGLPRLDYPDLPTAPGPAAAVPLIDAERPAVCLFTSGSTGLPMPHQRSWGSLVRNGRAEAERLGLLARGHAIVGTVPPQHSYGLESTVLLALLGNCAVWSGRPFYPADIAAALAAVPRPRLLVTTPVHLKALLEAGIPLPPVDQLLSATAPLDRALAARAEERYGAPLLEIYGCTESGQLASRRTTAGDAWTPLPGVVLEQEGDTTWARGGHVAGRVPLADRIDLADDGRFLLRGRHGDLVNIAGKRSSLAYLDHQLKAIPGVADGCFFLPEEPAGAGVTRLCAAVVAPGLDRDRLLEALRQRVESVFLPRPLLLVEALPRNATGKLPRAELLALLARHRSTP